MALFRIADETKKLEKIKSRKFSLEKELQEITERNLRDILRLDFVCSEFVVEDRRIDTLAFDKEIKSFVIIEYKIRENHSVVDQGMTYLSLMLENQAEFVLKYNEEKKATMQKKQIDWSQSKVIFISRAFTSFQKGATNFKGFPVDLWEVKKYGNNLIDYRQIEKPASRANVKELFRKDKNIVSEKESVEEVMRKIKIYTEEDHLKECSENIAALYNRFKEGILALGDIETKVNKGYINFIANAKNVTIAFILIHKTQLTLRINMPKGKLKDFDKIMKDTSKLKSEPRTDYKNRKKITSDKDLDYILGLVKQSLKYKGRKRSIRTR